MITRQITNTNDPFVTPTGGVVANSEVIFELVKTSTKKPISVFDALSGEYINSKPFSFMTNAQGEFTGQLWPNSRGEEQTCYKVTTENDHARPIYVTIVEGDGPISLIEARMNYQTISPPVISLFQATLASIHEQVNNAVSALKVVTTTENGMMLATDKVKLDNLNTSIDLLVPKATTVNGKALTGNIVLVASDLGLGSVNNTSDADKPLSTAAVTALALKAPLASPGFTGTPTAPTAAGGTSTTQLATTAFVAGAVAPLATAQALTDAVTPLASKLYVDNVIEAAVSPLATRTYVDDSLALKTNVATVGGFAPSQTPGAGQIPVLSANNTLLIGGAVDNTVDKLQVNGSVKITGSGLTVTGATASAYTCMYVERSDQAAAGVKDRALIDIMTSVGAARLVQLQDGITKNSIILYANGATFIGAYGTTYFGPSAAYGLKVDLPTTTLTQLNAVATGANAVFDINHIPSSNTERAQIRIFRSTNTSGTVDFQIFAGNGTATANHNLSGNGNSYLASATGVVMIGFTSPVANGGCLQLKSGVTFPATAVLSSNANTLDDYREASYTATAFGLSTAPTATVSYVKTGNTVVMQMPAVSGTSNSTVFSLTGMPVECRPSATRVALVRIDDNGVRALGTVSIGADGVMSFGANLLGGAFQATGTKGVLSSCFSYII